MTLPDKRHVGIKLFKLSHVKIRKYGSQHRIDPYRDYSERWEEIDWEKWLWSLWQGHWGFYESNQFDVRSLILLGFDDKPAPFSKEIAALQQSVNWEKHGHSTKVVNGWIDMDEQFGFD